MYRLIIQTMTDDVYFLDNICDPNSILALNSKHISSWFCLISVHSIAVVPLQHFLCYNTTSEPNCISVYWQGQAQLQEEGRNSPQ